MSSCHEPLSTSSVISFTKWNISHVNNEGSNSTAGIFSPFFLVLHLFYFWSHVHFTMENEKKKNQKKKTTHKKRRKKIQTEVWGSNVVMNGSNELWACHMTPPPPPQTQKDKYSLVEISGLDVLIILRGRGTDVDLRWSPFARSSKCKLICHFLFQFLLPLEIGIKG